MVPPDEKYHIPLLVLLFFIPLNIYRIGNNLGSGVQWALFHYQQTIYGDQVTAIIRYLEYVASGMVSGKSALSLLLWSLAACILIAAVVFLVITVLTAKPTGISWVGPLVILSGFLFLFSCMAQYGLTFHGPAGFCVPIGIPVVWGVGILLYKGSLPPEKKGETAEDLESKPGITDEDPVGYDGNE